MVSVVARGSASPSVTLGVAVPADAELLGNLLELYVHDLSAVFPHVELGRDGRYGYPPLGSYLSGSEAKVGYLIRCEGRVAGFILAQRGSPVTDDPDVFDIAEFFVLRRYRHRGVGRAAAELLWQLMPGSWTVRALVRNADAASFWRTTVMTYTHGAADERERLVGGERWTVWSFRDSIRA